MTLIQRFSDESELTFDDGKFDKWCIYLKRPNMDRYAPKDVEYFTRLSELAFVYGFNKIYIDFVAFYEITTKKIEQPVLNLIHQISFSYQADSLEVEILFVILYAGMVAEENKEFAILKKRIKRLGIHQTLIDRISPIMAANFSKGKKWVELDQICKTKGF